MSVRKYAEGTKVTVESSRGEISGILSKHGVQRMGWTSEPAGDSLLFELGGYSFRFYIARPSLDDVKRAYVDGGGRWSLVYDPQAKVDAEWRRRWRANVLLLKAKLEFIQSGDTTLIRELLPYAVLPGGQTVEDAITGGGLKLLAAGGSK